MMRFTNMRQLAHRPRQSRSVYCWLLIESSIPPLFTKDRRMIVRLVQVEIDQHASRSAGRVRNEQTLVEFEFRQRWLEI